MTINLAAWAVQAKLSVVSLDTDRYVYVSRIRSRRLRPMSELLAVELTEPPADHRPQSTP